MNEVDFYRIVGELDTGKKLPGAVYMHHSLLIETPPALRELINGIGLALKFNEADWNVLKLHSDQFKISFLFYPEFDAETYPTLRSSKVVDLSRKTVRDMDFSADPNPPILHRKELLVPIDYPGRDDFAQATREGEDAGLYRSTRSIGFRRNWLALIDATGYELADGRLFRKSALATLDPEDIVVSRERTAISRTRLSAPMQALSKHGFLDGDHTICDYGCGRGDDIEILHGLGMDVVGWDPNFRPEGERLPSDVVNLGYVINVIDDRSERDEALQSAFALAQRVLVVAAMIASDAHIAKFRSFKDGVITSRNTFQKYYAQEELKVYIETTLGKKALPVASGVYFIFKDEETEARFTFRRYRSAPQSARTRVHKKSQAAILQEQIALHQELFDAYWASALKIGRWPVSEEFSETSAVLTVFPTLKQAQRAMLEVYDVTELEFAERAARDDLLFAQAMSFFTGRAAFSHIPPSVQLDVRCFFRTYRELQNRARELLQSLTDTTQLERACAEVIATSMPHFLESNKSLSVRADSIARLPLILRAYIGCAEQLIGAVDQYNLIKVHIHTGKISVMRYDDFASKSLPLLIERVKISLWNQRVDYFDYVDEYKPRPLYWKSKFMSTDETSYQKQIGFDKRLDELGLAPEKPYFGFSEAELTDILNHKGLEIRGYRFYKRAAS